MGAPWTLTSCVSTSITRPDRMPPATSIASDSRVHSSTTVRHLSVCPFAQVSNTKSYAQTWIDRSGGHRAGPAQGDPAPAAAAEAPATPPGARGDGSGPCSSCALRVLGKSESGDSRTADTAPPDDASRPAPGHPGRPAATGSPGVDRATESKAHARRPDRPRARAYATCGRRTRAPTIFFG